MPNEPITLDHILKLAKQLSPLEKVRLIEGVAPDLEAPLAAASATSLQSAYGICADLGQAPAASEIDEARTQMFERFPREDI